MRQNAKGEGSLDETIAKHKGDVENVEWLDDDIELFEIASIFSIIPFEYGFSGIAGKKYEAIKDYLKWNGFEVSYWTPILSNMGTMWAHVAAESK